MEQKGFCLNCGKLDFLINDLCKECHTEEKDMVTVIKQYLKENPDSSAGEIAAGTGTSITKITRLIKNRTLI